MRRVTRTTAGALAALVIAAGLPTAAMAQTDETAPQPEQTQERTIDHVEVVRQRVLKAIDHRLERIDRLQERIKDSDSVEPQHAAHLTADLSASQGGLTALSAQASNASTIEELAAIFEDVVYEHRIYALRTPQTGLVLASDFGNTVADRLDTAAGAITEAAARAAEAGYDVSGVEALVAEAESFVSQGAGLVDPVADTVLPLEPSDVPDPARAVMQQAHDDMVEGREAFHSAHDLLREAAQLLADIIRSAAA